MKEIKQIVKTYLKNIPIEKVFLWEQNYRDISSGNFQKLKNKIINLGEFKPLGAVAGAEKNTYIVIGGNQRLKAYRDLGLKTVDVIFYPELNLSSKKDKETILQIALADNENDGYTDKDRLKLLIDEVGIDCSTLSDYSVIIDDKSFNLADLSQVTPITEEILEQAEAVLSVGVAPKRICFGDIIYLGSHRLICGDSTSTDTIAKLMAGERAEIVITDPPYGMHLKTNFSSMGGGNDYRPVIGDNDDFNPELITSIFKNFKKCPEIFLFGPDYYAKLLPDGGTWLAWDKRVGLEEAEFSTASFELIYSKAQHRKDILRCQWFGMCGLQKEPTKTRRLHPTQKPVRLLIDMLERYAGNMMNVVDIYGGSGSMMIACALKGKKCFMSEIDPLYCDIIVQRFMDIFPDEKVLIERAGAIVSVKAGENAV